MIRVRFERLAAAGRLRRSVFLAEGSQPVTEEIDIDPGLYPGTATAFDTDLHEHPPEELRRIGQAIALLALGPAGLAALRERRRETSAPIRIAFEESAECPEATALPWELMHHQLGLAYQIQADWPKALESYQEALAWLEKTGQHHEIGGTYHQVGRVYQLQGDWPKALESYQQALAWLEKTGQHHEIGGTYHQVGMVYQEQRDWPKALDNYQLALAWKEKAGQHHEIGSTLGQLGLLYEGQGDDVAAARHYQEALECFLSRGYSNPRDIVVAMRLLKRRFSDAAAQEDLTPVRQRFERLLPEHPELRELSERLDREPEGEA
jgi:tetratricopeptide (TPR) repeat protein